MFALTGDVTRPRASSVDEEREERSLAAASRAAAWGILGGVGGFLLLPFLPSAPAFLMAGAGMLVGGGGLAWTSSILLRRWKGLNRLGRVSTLLGIPLSLSLVAAGLGLAAWGGFLIVPPFLDLALWTMLLVGLVLGVTVGAATVKKLFEEESD